jgi:hypothetical protein
LPPNESDLAHAQDVMRFCATRRSVLLDQLNLLQLIVDHPARYDFSNGANAKEIAAAAVDTQTDLDLVASCASAAINSPSGAKFPKDFADDNKTIFPAATMPAILPLGKARPPQEKTIPNFVGLTLTGANLLSQQTGVPIAEFVPGGPDDPFAESLKALSLGVTNEDGVIVDHPHSDDQIVVKFQMQSPGSDLQPGATVFLGFELARGVPQ